MSQLDIAKDRINQYLAQADVQLSKYEYVQLAAKKSNIRPSLLALGAVGFLLCFLLFGIGGKFMSNLVGFSYPLYASYVSLRQRSAEQHIQWLTYWIVFAHFTLFESLTDVLMTWIPFYHVFKIAFLVWCFYPSTQGARVIYHSVVEPLLNRYESNIDSAATHVRTASSKIMGDVASDLSDSVNNSTRKMASDAVSNLIADQIEGGGEPKKAI